MDRFLDLRKVRQSSMECKVFKIGVRKVKFDLFGFNLPLYPNFCWSHKTNLSLFSTFLCIAIVSGQDWVTTERRLLLKIAFECCYIFLISFFNLLMFLRIFYNTLLIFLLWLFTSMGIERGLRFSNVILDDTFLLIDSHTIFVTLRLRRSWNFDQFLLWRVQIYIFGKFWLALSRADWISKLRFWDLFRWWLPIFD